MIPDFKKKQNSKGNKKLKFKNVFSEVSPSSVCVKMIQTKVLIR